MHDDHGPNINPARRVRAVAAIEPLERRTLLATLKVMPLGDSITEGRAGDATYRYWLWHQLRGAARDVDFVGSHHGVWNGSPRFSDFDMDHEGHVSFRADTLRDNVQQYVAAAAPHVVLLHVGTNDLLQGQSVEGTIDDVGQVIDRIRAGKADVTILLAKIIGSPFIPAIDAFNAKLPALAAQKDTSASRVILVDQNSGFDPMVDTDDGLHPDESGERKLADRWMAALAQVPQPLDPNPFLSDLPLLSARNGLGPVERNKSNGGALAGDGRSIKLNGKIYRKGLGVHAHSDVRFDLGGRFATFTTDAGVDDEVGNRAGSVIFRVYVDSVKVYDSGPVYGRTGTKRITVNVSGAHTLRLLVTDKGDGNTSDHASWANAQLFSLGQGGLPLGIPGGGAGGASGGCDGWYNGGSDDDDDDSDDRPNDELWSL